MNSNEIFAALAIAFVVFITVRGQLPAYMGLFVPQPAGGSTSVLGAAIGAGISALGAAGSGGGALTASGNVSSGTSGGTDGGLGGLY